VSINDTSTVEFYSSEYGKNDGETYDRTCHVNISGLTDGVVLDHVELVPRGPTANAVVAVQFTKFNAKTGSFVRFDNVNSENTSSCFTSDAATKSIFEMTVMGGRLDCLHFLVLSAATVLGQTKIIGSNIGGRVNITDPNVVILANNTLLNGVNLVGGAGSYLSGAWNGLNVTNNVCGPGQTLVDTSTGNRIVSGNTAC
jgi:hypothetical protein